MKDGLIKIAEEAGDAILAVYKAPEAIDTWKKADNSPVTKADLAAHHSIVRGLKQLTPDIPILSEEDSDIDYSIRKQWSRYWLVDPLDGTKEFIQRNNEFAVLIALIEAGYPTQAVVFAPALDTLYYADDTGAFKRQGQGPLTPISVAKWQGDICRVPVSRRHDRSKIPAQLGNGARLEPIPMGSALKLCLVADGQADVSMRRTASTCEWDTAAGQCIIERAGGGLLTFDGQRRQYNTSASLLNPPYLAIADLSVNWLEFIEPLE